MKIAPSILAADFAFLEKEIKSVASAGADWLHLDFADGHFVPNLTFGPPIVKKIRPITDLLFDVHLMVDKPDFLFPALAQTGVQRVTVHPEACPHLQQTLQKAHHFGLKPGIALNPQTSLNGIESILDEIDLILIMTVKPGFGGQSFLHEPLEKLRDLQQILTRYPKKEMYIQVDGGINKNTAPLAKAAGANVLVSGSYIFDTEDRGKAIRSLR